MPFTPLHLGPALAIGLPLRKYLHVPTFILANVVLDIEPLLVVLFRLDYPLHGYMHTLLSAVAVGLILGFVMFRLETSIKPFYRKTKLEADNNLRLKSFLLAGIFGTTLHILFDSIMHSDIQPFFPLSANPLLNSSFSGQLGVNIVCMWLGIFGIAYYVVLLVYSMRKKTVNNTNRV